MLVLSRKLNETIVIGDDISVTVVELGHKKIRLGIEAPRQLTVLRKELLNGDKPKARPALGDMPSPVPQ